MGMTCLLHDIGYTKLDFNPRVPRSELSAEQWQRYTEHPIAGAQLLADKPYITKGILEMIADHEEIGDAQGFPQKKRLATLSLPQQIINLANDFDRLSLIRKQTHSEIAKTFLQDRIGYFDLNHIKFLISLLKN
jgi:HD-GYP domain-containing protein (c-di-GMP phosphodiesterase class II)